MLTLDIRITRLLYMNIKYGFDLAINAVKVEGLPLSTTPTTNEFSMI